MEKPHNNRSFGVKIALGICVIIAALIVFRPGFIKGNIFIPVFDKMHTVKRNKPVNVSIIPTGIHNRTAERGFAHLSKYVSGSAPRVNEQKGSAYNSDVNLENVRVGDVLPFLKDAALYGTISTNLELSIIPDSSFTISWKLEATINDVVFSSDKLSINLKGKPIKIKSHGLFYWNSRTIRIDAFEAQIDQFEPWSLTGTVNNILSDDMAADLIFKADRIPITGLGDIISGPAMRWLENVDISGFAHAAFSFQGKMRSPEINGHLALYGKRIAAGHITFQSYDADIPVLYKDDTLKLGTIRMNIKKISNGIYTQREGLNFMLRDVSCSVPRLNHKQAVIKSEGVRFKAGGLVITRDGTEVYSDADISVNSSIESDMDKQLIVFQNTALHTAFIHGAHADVTVDMGTPVSIEAHVAYDGFGLDSFLQKIPPGMIDTKGYKVHGTGALRSSFRMHALETGSARISGTAQLNIAEAGFSSPDELKIGEGIEMKISHRFAFPVTMNRIEFSSELETTGFELLINKFYGDFTDKSIYMTAIGEYRKDGDLIHLSHAEAGITGMGNILLSGSISGISAVPSIDAQIQADNMSNREMYEFFVRETFQEQFPFLSFLEIDGESSMNITLKGMPEEFTAQGNIKISHMNITTKAPGLNVQDIRLSMPVDISYPEKGPSAQPEEYGNMSIAKYSWSLLQFNDINLLPAIWNNDLIFKEDLNLPVFGGMIALKDVSFIDLLSRNRTLRLAMDIRDIDLAEASRAVELPEFSGRLTGNIPMAIITENKLDTEGEIIAKVFGGQVKVNGLSADNVFSPIRSLESSIEIEGIDLGEMTRTFDFGHISGILRGNVENLVIVNGQAQSFTTLIETVKKRGTKQQVSVEALRKISILGTGASTSLLDRGIYRLFKKYRYDKMGFQASLNNDNLMLQGIERDSEKEYLVKGGLLPPKVNIVTFSQHISFKEMVKRLKRIEQADVE